VHSSARDFKSVYELFKSLLIYCEFTDAENFKRDSLTIRFMKNIEYSMWFTYFKKVGRTKKLREIACINKKF